MKRTMGWWGLVVVGGVVLGGAIAACGGFPVASPDAASPASPSSNPIVETAEAASPTEPVAQAPAEAASPTVEIGEFSLQEVFDLDAGGCGMTLWRAEDTRPPADRGFVFINGMQDNTMLMKINGEVMRFQRVSFGGTAFYGQYTTQAFSHENPEVWVEVTVTLGERGEIESIALPDGTLRLEMEGAVEEIHVVGDAGC